MKNCFIISVEVFVTRRVGTITLKNEDSIDIPEKKPHRVLNTGTIDLVFIEVQCGDSCREDDIERIEDDYGRA